MPGSLPGVNVGTCGSCGGPVVFDRGRGEASCRCGASRIPRAFLAWGVASAKPGPK